MPPRPRTPRSVPATALRPAARDSARDAAVEERWGENVDAPPSPLAALVDAAAEAGQLDPRTLADRVGMSSGALQAALVDPTRLAREQRDALAGALGVDRAVVRAACEAAARDRRPSIDDDVAAPEPAPTDRAADDDASAPPSPASAPRREAPGETPRETPRETPFPVSPSLELPGAAPRTLVELLERTIAAVADDALGRRMRLSLLTTVHTAAAEAGRTLPPEAHELRARVLRGAPAWVGEGGTFVDDTSAPEDRALLDAVAGAVRAAQRDGGGYDDLFAPLHDDALDVLLRRSTAAVRPAALGATSACVVTPPLFGRHLVVCSADAAPDQRRVALRRALAHVLCGHVGEHTPLPFPAPAAVARTADVFALADLVPFWQLDAWRRGPRDGWRAIMARVAEAATSLAGDWDDVRAAEAGRLRVLLYRERKI